MGLRELILRANKGYERNYPGEDLILKCYENWGDQDCGDTLALFIAKEIADTYDPTASDRDQIASAIKAMKSAIYDLEDIIKELE